MSNQMKASSDRIDRVFNKLTSVKDEAEGKYVSYCMLCGMYMILRQMSMLS